MCEVEAWQSNGALVPGGKPLAIREPFCPQVSPLDVTNVPRPYVATGSDAIWFGYIELMLKSSWANYSQANLPNLRRLFVDARTEAEESSYSRNAVGGGLLVVALHTVDTS